MEKKNSLSIKGKFQEMDETDKTKGEKVEFGTYKFVVKFINRTSDKAKRMVAREGEKDYVETTGTKWYATVNPTA